MTPPEFGKLVAEAVDPLADTSPVHIYDDHGSYCGKRLGDFTRGLHYRAVTEGRFVEQGMCSQCLGAWRYAKARDD